MILEKSYYEDVADRLLVTFLAMKRQERQHETHLWRGEQGVLFYLASKEEGVCAGRISKDLNIGSGGVANLLNGLEKKGLIERTMSPTDRRSVIVRASEAGRTLIRQYREEGRRHVVERLERLGQEDTEALLRILGRIVALEEQEG